MPMFVLSHLPKSSIKSLKIKFSTVVKINFPVVKINFHGGKNQFSSPVTPANFRAGYACTGNTLI